MHYSRLILSVLFCLASTDAILKTLMRNYRLKIEEDRKKSAPVVIPPRPVEKKQNSIIGIIGSTLAFTAKISVPVIAVGGTAFVGHKIWKKWNDNKKQNVFPTKKKTQTTSSGTPVTSSTSKTSTAASTMSTEQLLSITREMSGEEGASNSVEAPIKASSSGENGPVILLFDCDDKLTTPADITARKEYFTLMSNLTANGNVFNTVYIPSSGNGNPHIIEKNETFRPNWKFLPGTFEGKKYSAAIREKFDIKGEELRIMLLASDLSVVSENALDLLRINPFGMPWTPTSLKDILGNTFLSPSLSINETVNVDVSDKVIGLYFSASWCKPCQTFTPILLEKYENLTLKDSASELIFVSLDQEEDAFDEYRKKMKWPSIPFRDVRRALLQIGLQIKSIPALIFIDQQGKIITSSGVSSIMTDPNLENYPYPEGAVDLTTGTNVEKLQRTVSLIAFTDGCPAHVQAATRKVMGELYSDSNVPVKIPRSPRADLLFGTLEAPGKLNEALRLLCSLPPADENIIQLVMLDLMEEKYFHVSIPIDPSLDSTVIESRIKTVANKLAMGFRQYNVQMSPMIKLAPPSFSQQQQGEEGGDFDLEPPSPAAQ